MGGIESNPSPTDKIFYDGWTRDASRFLWPSIGAMEITIAGWLKWLLKYVDRRSKGGSFMFAAANAILSKSLDDLKQKYYPDHEGQITQDMRWDCIKQNLDVLLPAILALDVEAELKAISRDFKESLLQFICKFPQATMH